MSVTPPPRSSYLIMDFTPSGGHKNKRGIKLKERKRWERKLQDGVSTLKSSKPRR